MQTNWSIESEKINGQTIPQMPGARPMVDPHAEGNVDPNLYPEPKEATNKIRGKNDIIEYLFGAVDQELLTVKTFYFFFYSAFGSLFPLMGVYFKQMGMNAGQCGLLIGLRPFIEFFSAPFWGSWADRWQKGKLILLASLSCWIIFTLPLGFIQPPPTSCMLSENGTNYLYIPDADVKVKKRSINFDVKPFTNYNGIFEEGSQIKNSSVIEMLQFNEKNKYSVSSDISNTNNDKLYRRNLTHTTQAILGKLNTSQLFQASNKHVNSNKTMEQKNSMGDYYENTTHNVQQNSPINFFTDSGESNNIVDQINVYREKPETKDPNFIKRIRRNIRFQSYASSGQSPISVSFAANYKPNEHKLWVKPQFSTVVYNLPDIQKTFFLLLMLVIVGEFFSAPAITLADSAVITLLGEDADRYGHQRMFGSLGWGLAMFFVGIALDESTSFPDHPCKPDSKEKNYTICFTIFSVLMGAALITATQINFKYESHQLEPETEKFSDEPTREEQLQSQLSQQLNLPGLQDSSTSKIQPKSQPLEGKTKMFAQTTREIPEWVTILKQFKDLKCASFLFVAWFMGFGIGLIFTFLFWHLQDYGGTPTLFGVASVINHVSEIFAYFFSFKLIRQIGHVKVLCLGLGGNILRFLYISWLKNPWWVLPFEFIQGITHAAVWAACCSYIAHNTPAPLRSSAQGVLQGLHHGLGRGCGAVIGGLFVAIYGTTATFRAYGILCFIVLSAFIFINFYRKDTGFISDLPQSEDPHQVAEVTHLAPHGVPSNAIPRALSSNRLHELANQDPSYGTIFQTSGSNLTVPGGEAPANSNNPFLSTVGQGNQNYCCITKGDNEFIRRSFQTYDEIVSKDYNIEKMPPLTNHLQAQQPCTNPFHQHDYGW